MRVYWSWPCTLLLVSALCAATSASPCDVAPRVNGSSLTLNINTADPTLPDNVTYSCDLGKLFSDGAPIKTFVCEQVTDWTEVEALACNDRRLEHVCFFWIGQKYSFSAGRDICAERGGHLAEIYSESEDDAINDIRNGKHTWIGVVYNPGDETYSYAHSGAALRYAENWYWYSSPDNGECTVMYTRYQLYLWTMSSCGSEYNVACEQLLYDSCQAAPPMMNAVIEYFPLYVLYHCNQGYAFPDGRVSIKLDCPCEPSWEDLLLGLSCQVREPSMSCYTATTADDCADNQGFPAVILSSQQNDNITLRGLIGYIGLRYDVSELAWFWEGPWQEKIPLSSTGFTNWKSGEEDPPDEEMCAMIDNEGEWEQHDCGHDHDVVCERSKYEICSKAPEIPNSLRTVTADEVTYYCNGGSVFNDWPAHPEKRYPCTCDADWTDAMGENCTARTAEDVCFFRLQTSVYYDGAEAACNLHNATLARVFSSEERTKLRQHEAASSWIAGNIIASDRMKTFEFRYGTYGPIMNFTSFLNGEPNGVEHCLYVHRHGYWQDQDCNVNRLPTCEKKSGDSCDPLPNNPNTEYEILPGANLGVRFTCHLGWVLSSGSRDIEAVCCAITGRTTLGNAYTCRERRTTDMCFWTATHESGASVTCSEAADMCSGQQGMLAAVTNQAENDVIGALGGFIDLKEVDGEWRWEQHNDTVSWTNWNPGNHTGACVKANCSSGICDWMQTDSAVASVCERPKVEICQEAPDLADMTKTIKTTYVKYRCRDSRMTMSNGLNYMNIACPCLPVTWDTIIFPNCSKYHPIHNLNSPKLQQVPSYS